MRSGQPAVVGPLSGVGESRHVEMLEGNEGSFNSSHSLAADISVETNLIGKTPGIVSQKLLSVVRLQTLVQKILLIPDEGLYLGEPALILIERVGFKTIEQSL